MKKIFIMLTILLSGCSTKLTISSTPEVARLSFKGQDFITPFTVQYSNMWERELPYVLYKDGYKTQSGYLPSESQNLNFILQPSE